MSVTQNESLIPSSNAPSSSSNATSNSSDAPSSSSNVKPAHDLMGFQYKTESALVAWPLTYDAALEMACDTFPELRDSATEDIHFDIRAETRQMLDNGKTVAERITVRVTRSAWPKISRTLRRGEFVQIRVKEPPRSRSPSPASTLVDPPAYAQVDSVKYGTSLRPEDAQRSTGLLSGLFRSRSRSNSRESMKKVATVNVVP
ncbi:hypothetical protein FA95DRAFT_292724 [Auriscalpium vulgare]|uniref:Uncharacterized protein n=1 Tax=Auriscalpium vulgare TaxID=40419 RepID=A0ACB8RJ76_9AGAM|nr:hypothetical protein FA95DRAFT_292724 [Auriscalpium vulgare]